jgi:O-antigen/teichoic acid export membrane protein
MSAEVIEQPKMSAEHHKVSFFRQSGWMMITAVGGGALMFLVQIFAKKVLKDNNAEYSAFAALIQVTNWIQIPALGLQMVFAQQTAAAITDLQKRQLAATAKAVMRWTFCLWLVVALLALICHNQWTVALKLSNPASLWLTVTVGLVMLWLPIFQGLLQGRQNFLWLGWTSVFNGAGRLLFVAIVLLIFHGLAAGIMFAVLMGMLVTLITAVSQNLDLWKVPAASFDERGWLRRVLPLTLGFGVSTFIFSADAVVVQNFLGEGGKAADYMFAATLCRAIVLFTAPLAQVMFPKLVHGRASSQKTNLLGVTLLGTGGLSGLAVLGLVLVSPFIMQHFSKGDYGAMEKLIPLFAGAMVPLGMGNVLLNHLMAHSRFKIVPWIVALAVGYWIALQYFHDSFRSVIETFGVSTVLYLGVCAWFTWVVEKAD